MRSMTGWGRGVAAVDGWQVAVEVRAVNSRYREIVVHLPFPDVEQEEFIRQKVAEFVVRGHLDVFVTILQSPAPAYVLKIDKTLARAYYREIAVLQDELGLPAGVSTADILSLPGVIATPDTAAGIPRAGTPGNIPGAAVEQALDQAMAGLVAMREREGAATYADLRVRLEAAAALAEEIAGRAPVVLEEYYQRLRKRVMMMLRDVAGQVQMEIDLARLEQEMVIFADRADISEEIARIRSHISQLRLVMDEPGAVGRKMDFLLQEVFREFNTIASKSPDAVTAQLVVQVKSELEKLREQVQNVE